jgi:diguanylate cyclase (GGDEF)-like protein
MQPAQAPPESGGAPGYRRPRAWVLLLALTPVLAVAYAMLPTTGDSRVIAYPLYGIAMAVLIGLSVLRLHPARRRAWLVIAVALTLLSVGDVTYTVLQLTDGEVPYPSLADLGYLAGYVALLVGVTDLFRGRTTGSERLALIDAAILTTGVAAVFWIFIVLPTITGTTDLLTIGVSMAYPAADLILLMLGLHAVLAGGGSPRFLKLMLLGISIYFVSDVVYAVAVNQGTYGFGDTVDLGWIVGLLLIGVAAIHPSTREPVVVLAKAETSLGRRRLALLALAAFLAPAMLVVRAASLDFPTVAGLVLTWIVLFGLVLMRLATTLDALGTSLIQRRSLQDDLAFQATHDSLTRLANRGLFETRLDVAVARNASGTGLIFLDLDDFKTVNDTLGHATGDALLQTIATRIHRELRGTDLVARLGGDEFAVLVEHCPDDATLRALAERILVAIRAPVALAGRHLVTHASAGMAFGRVGLTGLELMGDADIAMYQAKSNGKDQVERHDPAMHDAIVLRYELRSELAAAVVSRDFVLEYQPIMNIITGDIVAGEALVRWRHPRRGILAPGEFIGIAETSGQIHELGLWILREACLAAARWPSLPDGRARSVGINLAPAQLLGPRFLGELMAVLAETGIDPKRVTLEVTESALIDLEAATPALAAISKLGVKLALDDFGTGYSALSYLADLPFDIVKVDQSFVSGMGENERTESLLKGILGLCRSLGLLAVAEGVETEAQLARLRRLGCPEGQGYLFARPMPAHAFQALLVSNAATNGVSSTPLPRSVSMAPEA